MAAQALGAGSRGDLRHRGRLNAGQVERVLGRPDPVASGPDTEAPGVGGVAHLLGSLGSLGWFEEDSCPHEGKGAILPGQSRFF